MVQNRSRRNGRLRKVLVTKDARELRIWKIIKDCTLFYSLASVEEDDIHYKMIQFVQRPSSTCQTPASSFLSPLKVV